MRRAPDRSGESGAVTAETAMVLPLLVAVTIVLVWALSLGIAQIRTVDAAREVARALARGESEPAATALGLAVAPPEARIDVTAVGEVITVRVRAAVDGPGGLFAVASPVVRAEATARSER